MKTDGKAPNEVPLDALKFRDLEGATGYQRPPGLEIRLEGVSVEGDSLLARGIIENLTPDSLELVLQLPQRCLLHFAAREEIQLVPSPLPRRPETFPWPRAFEVPGQTRVAWTACLALADYRWSGTPEVSVQWSVLVWAESKGAGVSGTATVKLPAAALR